MIPFTVHPVEGKGTVPDQLPVQAAVRRMVQILKKDPEQVALPLDLLFFVHMNGNPFHFSSFPMHKLPKRYKSQTRKARRPEIPASAPRFPDTAAVFAA